jgi:ribosomal protein S17E
MLAHTISTINVSIYLEMQDNILSKLTHIYVPMFDLLSISTPTRKSAMKLLSSPQSVSGVRNKITGFTTHLMKRISKGPVRGISFKLQEEERERKGIQPEPPELSPGPGIFMLIRLHLDQYTPEISAIDPASFEHGLQVDTDTKDLLRSLGFDSLPVNVITVTATQGSARGMLF